MAPRIDPKDPRFRRFRIGMYVLYVAIVAVFSTAVSVSVIRSVLEMSPRRARDTDELFPPQRCVSEAEVLWRRLDDERKAFTRSQPARLVDEEFSQFRVEWLRKMRDLEVRCAANTEARRPLRDMFRKLERVQDLYTTHAVQYAGEVGPAVDDLLASFSANRDAGR